MRCSTDYGDILGGLSPLFMLGLLREIERIWRVLKEPRLEPVGPKSWVGFAPHVGHRSSEMTSPASGTVTQVDPSKVATWDKIWARCETRA